MEEKKKSIEKTAKKWWDFTRNKLKMIRWLKKKEGDAEMQRSTSCRIDSAQDQLTAYQAWLNIVYLAIKDVLHLFITPKTSFTKRSLVSGRSRGGGGGGGWFPTLFLGRSGEIFFKRGPPSDFRVWNEWAPTYREVWIRFCVRYISVNRNG